MTSDVERAVVTFEAPHGQDAATLRDGDVIEFGRDASCRVRFGYAPTPDHGLARIAGRLLVAGGRVFVESLAELGHRAVEVRVDAGPVVQLAHGEAFAPSTDQFEVLVHGDRVWRLRVVERRADATRSATSADPPTNRVSLTLTQSQMRVLRAYCAPVLRGHLEPATHRQVADELDLHPNTVRETLYEIYARMFAAGIPIPDVGDKRVAVVEAARVHGLVHDDGT